MTSPHIALVGCGRWGRHILRDLFGLRCAVSVVDPDDAARQYARANGARATTERLDEARSIDGVIVSTPASTHATIVGEALELGVPVFCEKPFVLSVTDANALAARGGDRLFVMDKWRYHEGIEALRDLARSPAAGEIVALHTTRIGWSPAQVDVDPVWTLAPHDLAIALEILGTIPEPVTARADVHDGRVVGLTAALGERPSLTIEVSGASPIARREVRLTCTGLVAALPDAMSDHLLVIERGSHNSGATRTRAIGTEPPLVRELRAFVAHLAGGPPPRSSAADAALATTVLSTLRRMAGLDGENRRRDIEDLHDDDKLDTAV